MGTTTEKRRSSESECVVFYGVPWETYGEESAGPEAQGKGSGVRCAAQHAPCCNFLPEVMAMSRPVAAKEEIAAFCRRHHIRKLSLFGSVLRDDFRPDSDIDVLVEFEPGHAVGLGIIDIEEELSQLFGGHKVDMVREKYLNRRLRSRIIDSAEVQYAEG